MLLNGFWLYIYSLFHLVDLSLDEYEELQRAAQERADIVAKYDKVMCIKILLVSRLTLSCEWQKSGSCKNWIEKHTWKLKK